MDRPKCYLCTSNNSIIKYKIGPWFIRSCNNCNFIFVDPKPKDAFLQKYYSTFEANIFEKSKIIINDSKHTLKLLNKYKKTRNKLLDIGCGNGSFMSEAKKFKWVPFGIDSSQVLIKYIKSHTNLSVAKADILNYKNKDRYDLITLNQVIEHFTNPKIILKKCHSLLNKFGLLYIATPNINSYAARIRKEESDYLIPPEHVSYFDQVTLKNLLKKLNYKILYIGTWSYPVDLAAIIKYLLGKRKNVINSGTAVKQNWIKRFKYLLFDQIFCTSFYRLLNFNSGGTQLEILAQKI